MSNVHRLVFHHHPMEHVENVRHHPGTRCLWTTLRRLQVTRHGSFKSREDLSKLNIHIPFDIYNNPVRKKKTPVLEVSHSRFVFGGHPKMHSYLWSLWVPSQIKVCQRQMSHQHPPRVCGYASSSPSPSPSPSPSSSSSSPSSSSSSPSSSPSSPLICSSSTWVFLQLKRLWMRSSDISWL